MRRKTKSRALTLMRRLAASRSCAGCKRSGIMIASPRPSRAANACFHPADRPAKSARALRAGWRGAPAPLLDPNTWAADGANAIGSFHPSPDGACWYTVQDGGSDWRIIRVLDVATGQTLGDEVRWAKFTPVEWHPDGRSFFYSRYPEPPAGEMYTALNYNHAIYRHRVGAAQSEDQLIYTSPITRATACAEVSDDDRWLVVTVSRGTDARYEIVLIDLPRANARPRVLIPSFANAISSSAKARRAFFLPIGAPRGAASSDRSRPRAGSQLAHHRGRGRRRARQRRSRRRRDLRELFRNARLQRAGAILAGRLIGGGEIELPGLGLRRLRGSPESHVTYYSFKLQSPADDLSPRRAQRRDTVFAPRSSPSIPMITSSSGVLRSRRMERASMFIVHRRDVTLRRRAPHAALRPMAASTRAAAQLPGAAPAMAGDGRGVCSPTFAAAASTARHGTMAPLAEQAKRL